MSRTTTLATTVSVYLGLNIQVEDRGEMFLRTIRLIPLTGLIILLMRLYAPLARMTYYTSRIAFSMPHISLSLAPLYSWAQSLSIFFSFVQIGLKAALYGVGVPV